MALTRPLKSAISAHVIALVRSTGEGPVQRRPDGLFGPASVAWRVHADVTTMMIGGVAGLLLQMLHPAVLAGVWDHSNFRGDMAGRLRRTARFIAVTTYAGPEEARAAIAKVRAVHERIGGLLPDGTPYRADDPALLAWVHVTEALSFLDAWIAYGEPGMSMRDQDRYFAEMAVMAHALGADPIPLSRAQAMDQLEAARPLLSCDERTREVARMVLTARIGNRATEPFRVLVTQAAIDQLPDWARRLHGLDGPRFSRPLVRVGVLGVARTLRWALS